MFYLLINNEFKITFNKKGLYGGHQVPSCSQGSSESQYLKLPSTHFCTQNIWWAHDFHMGSLGLQRS